MDANHGNRERSHLQQLSERWSPLGVGANHRLLERRMPEEAKARGNALDMLTSGRCPERYSGESEATSQHTGS
jgi:hypothetical protein